MKPTKNQIKEAICYFYNVPSDSIEFHKNPKNVSMIQFIPKPHYDSGGGVDAMDFDECNIIITWKEALEVAREYKNLSKLSVDTGSPVAPYSGTEDFDLPF